VLDIIKDLCIRKLPEEFNLSRADDIQVIAPMYKGIAGIDNINAELQQLLNPENQSFVHQGRSFRLYDKVMQVRNNYEKDVYNGDIGKIQRIEFEDQRLLIQFYGKMVDYSFEEMDELVLAYSISIHKSQGSEYPAVIVPLLYQYYIMLQRNLLYTAVTRAKRLLVLIGSKQALSIAIRNNKIKRRFTNLKTRLKTMGDNII